MLEILKAMAILYDKNVKETSFMNLVPFLNFYFWNQQKKQFACSNKSCAIVQ